jgi:ParB family chromosome partitioning protein
MASAARDALLVEQLTEIDSEYSIETALIDLGPRLRPIDRLWSAALGELMLREGQRVPIDIARNPKTDRWQVHGAGGHRLDGAGCAGIEYVKAKVHAWDPDAAELREIADNLHRRDLDPLDRAEFVSRAVDAQKRRAGIKPGQDGRAASAQARWQKELKKQAVDANDIMSLAYGWTQEVADALGFNKRTIERDLLLRRIPEALRQRLRAVRHPVLGNAAQLRTLAKLDGDAQVRVVDLLTGAEPAKSVSEALGRLKGSNRVADDAAAKNLSAFIGAFSRMSLSERKGALHELRELLPAGYRLEIGGEPAPAVAEPAAPAVAIRASVKPDHMICLECGDKIVNLQVHLNTKHQMRFADYLTRWKLPCDYPTVAPYSEPSAALITECDGDLALIRAVVGSWHGKPSKAIDAAITEAGGTIRFANGTYEIKLARVNATCTAGGPNLISAWLRAADKRLEQAERLGLRGGK